MKTHGTRTVRRATVQDLPGAYRVCLKTGNSGSDATDDFRNPDLLGQVFVGPYIIGESDNAFVVTDEEGVGGYALAVKDTKSFEAWTEAHWWPTLREQYPLVEDDSEDALVIQLMHSPPHADPELLETYPAHLHIDLLPRLHRQGIGGLMMARLLETLRERGASGVHLGVGVRNSNAVEFYRHLGFTALNEGPDELVMGMAL